MGKKVGRRIQITIHCFCSSTLYFPHRGGLFFLFLFFSLFKFQNTLISLSYYIPIIRLIHLVISSSVSDGAFRAVRKSHVFLLSCPDEDAHLPEPFVSSWHLALTAQEVARGAVTERDSQRASVKIYFLCVKRLPLAIILDLVKFT